MCPVHTTIIWRWTWAICTVHSAALKDSWRRCWHGGHLPTWPLKKRGDFYKNRNLSNGTTLGSVWGPFLLMKARKSLGAFCGRIFKIIMLPSCCFHIMQPCWCNFYLEYVLINNEIRTGIWIWVAKYYFCNFSEMNDAQLDFNTLL